MRTRLSMVLSALLALASWCAFAQTSPAFEVAVIKPAVTMDMAATIAAIREGHSPKMGAQINASGAEYSHMALSDLIALAWNVKPYQITGPDWLRTQRFDITARLPDGASMDDVPRMLQTLLEERFRLALRRTSEERPVLALLVGRGGPKMKESPEPQSAAAGGDLPLKPGEVKVDMGDGPVRMAVGSGLSGTMDMSEKGAVSYKTDPVTRTMHMDGSRITMPGFADMPAQLSQMIDGDGRQIVDMTGLKGRYQVALDFSMTDLRGIARDMGLDLPGIQSSAPAGFASDPGGSSIVTAVQALGLRLEQRKAMVEQLAVEHVERAPTDN